MKKLLKMFVPATVFAASMALPGLADPKPADAVKADPQAVVNFYAGRTYVWKNCKGGVYYGAGWEAQAYCNKDGPSVGIGTWTVNAKGQLCHTLQWYWPKGSGYGTKEPETDCINHAGTTSGELWHNWPDSADWWRLTDNKKFQPKGFKDKSKIKRLRRKLGV